MTEPDRVIITTLAAIQTFAEFMKDCATPADFMNKIEALPEAELMTIFGSIDAVRLITPTLVKMAGSTLMAKGYRLMHSEMVPGRPRH